MTDRTTAAGLAAVGAVAAVVARGATRNGMYANPDSVSYLRMADGLPLLEHPPGHFPEGYPAALAILQSVGFGPLGSARVLGAGLAGSNAVLGGLVAHRMAGGRWGVGVAAALAASAHLATLSTGVLSEPLFIGLLLTWLLLVGSDRPALAVAAGAVAAAAYCTRYAGLALVPAGLLVLRSDRRRAVGYLVGAGAPLAAWGGWHVVRGGLADRPLAWHPPSAAKLEGGLMSIAGWLDGDRGPAVAGAAVLVGGAALLWRAGHLRGDQAPAAAAGCYLAALLATTAVVYAQTPLDPRLLTPLLVLVLVSLPGLTALPRRVLPVAVSAVALAVLANAAATRRQLDPLDRSTLGLGDDPTVVEARSLTGALVSNAPGALWLHGGLEARWVPKDIDPYTARVRPEVVAELAALRASLRPGDHLVWLRFYDYRSYLPTEAEVVSALGLVLELERPDGAIYGVP